MYVMHACTYVRMYVCIYLSIEVADGRPNPMPFLRWSKCTAVAEVWCLWAPVGARAHVMRERTRAHNEPDMYGCAH